MWKAGFYEMKKWKMLWWFNFDVEGVIGLIKKLVNLVKDMVNRG